MQRYKIFHRTYYSYPGAVTLGPHTLLLRPREGHELRVESSALRITPKATLLWHRDVEGNSVAAATFTTPTTQLVVESEIIIQQFNETPLDFMVAPYALSYPFAYKSYDHMLLFPYMVLPEGEDLNLVKNWISAFWKTGQSIQTYSLLQRLAEHINKTLNYQIREEPGVQSARETLACGTGSCRDFAALFMDAARCLGLATRFVSGYLYAPFADGIGATHAWAEVYLPGAGWKGFDPTIGKIVGTDHIPVAVARLPESAPPIEGSFVGGTHSSMDVGVWVSKCDDPSS